MNRGFTLIELMVSVMIFSVVMVVSLGSLLAISAGERKAETLKSVMDNLNFALESMSRTIRTGTYYHCGTSGSGPQNCGSPSDTLQNPQSYLSFVDVSGDKVAYCLYTTSSGGVIRRQIVSGSDTLSTNCADNNAFSDLTAAEVKISNLAFYVKGACSQSGVESCTGSSPDSIQPKVTIVVSGSVDLGSGVPTAFNVQTSVTQRLYDQ